MNKQLQAQVDEARAGALQVLRHNRCGPFHGLPRTAGWGYPEPYTRDLMIASLGILTSGDEELVEALRCVLKSLAQNQSAHGHIPSLVHDPDGRGASDTTPLFLIALGVFRRATGERSFLKDAARKAILWMDYQSPEDRMMVAQQPTTDWRDEQWVLGYGLYVNTLVYAYLRLHRLNDRAARLRELMHRFAVQSDGRHRHVHHGLALPSKPYYAFWAFKEYSNERFDLLGNSLAILFGVASPSRADALLSWVEVECKALRARGDVAVDLPPCLFPYVRREDPDWRARNEIFNRQGEYHNGGVWPFICGFYIAAAVAARRYRLAEEKLGALTRIVRFARNHDVPYGFNEWFRAQDGTPRGEDWQTWSAAMYLYAAACVESRRTPFLDAVRPAESK